jgi:phage shock protein C
MVKKLFRSKNDKVLLGVCGGIATYFGIDPVIVRLLWVLFAFCGGAGVLAYIIAAFVMPLEV